jgi:hypothetical protein
MAQLDLYSFVSAHASLRAIKLAAGRNGPVAAIKQQIQRLPESEVRVPTE